MSAQHCLQIEAQALGLLHLVTVVVAISHLPSPGDDEKCAYLTDEP